MLYLFFEHIGSGTQVIIFSIVFLCFYCVYVLVFFLNTQDHRHIGAHSSLSPFQLSEQVMVNSSFTVHTSNILDNPIL